LGGMALVFAFLLIFYRAEIRASAMHAVGVFREAGILPFFAALAILPAVGFPLSAFFVAAGPIYGPTLGPWHVVAFGTLAMAVNVSLSYWISAHPLHQFATRLAHRAGYRLPEVPSDRAWKLTLLVRIIPGVPFFIQSYLLGIARVSFGAYLAISLLVEFVYFASAVLFGTAALTGDRKAMAAAAALFVLIAATLHVLRKNWSVAKKT
jgi:uncharacterized membrane protein YdjX (TVP38/TMEM64 family)